MIRRLRRVFFVSVMMLSWAKPVGSQTHRFAEEFLENAHLFNDNALTVWPDQAQPDAFAAYFAVPTPLAPPVMVTKGALRPVMTPSRTPVPLTSLPTAPPLATANPPIAPTAAPQPTALATARVIATVPPATAIATSAASPVATVLPTSIATTPATTVKTTSVATALPTLIPTLVSTATQTSVALTPLATGVVTATPAVTVTATPTQSKLTPISLITNTVPMLYRTFITKPTELVVSVVTAYTPGYGDKINGKTWGANGSVVLDGHFACGSRWRLGTVIELTGIAAGRLRERNIAFRGVCVDRGEEWVQDEEGNILPGRFANDQIDIALASGENRTRRALDIGRMRGVRVRVLYLPDPNIPFKNWFANRACGADIYSCDVFPPPIDQLPVWDHERWISKVNTRFKQLLDLENDDCDGPRLTTCIF